MRLSIEVDDRIVQHCEEYIKWLAAREDLTIGPRRVRAYLIKAIENTIHDVAHDDPARLIGSDFVR